MPGYETWGAEERKELNDVLETGILMRFGFDGARKGIWKAKELEATISKKFGCRYTHLVSSGTNLPELHLDIHVNSQQPGERFVFVNMRKYLEGEAIKEGPTVERITAEGVILNQRGLRFLLPRQ